MSEFAVASNGTREIILWCRREVADEHTPAGGTCGWVINGCWWARFDSLGQGVADAKHGRIVWRGEVPHPYDRHYNEAIFWLNQMNASWWTRLKYQLANLNFFDNLSKRFKRAWCAFEAPIHG